MKQLITSIGLMAILLTSANQAQAFEGVCGDNNGDDSVDIGDLIQLVNYMFQQGPEPALIENADVNGSGGQPDIGDLVYLVNYMFQQGNPLWCAPSADFFYGLCTRGAGCTDSGFGLSQGSSTFINYSMELSPVGYDTISMQDLGQDSFWINLPTDQVITMQAIALPGRSHRSH